MAIKPTAFWAFRHGPTLWNMQKRIQGNVDTNILQDQIVAYLTALHIERIPEPDVIVLSTLKRTEQTAQAVLTYRHWPKIPFHKDAQLNERRWGIFEGIVDRQARQRVIDEPQLRPAFPDVTRLEDVAKIWDADGYKVAGGESSDEVAARVKPALVRIAKHYAGHKILFISHAGVLISLGLDHEAISQFHIEKDTIYLS